MKSAPFLPFAHRPNPINAFHLIAKLLGIARHSGITAICVALTLGIFHLTTEAQTRQWTWMGGSNAQNQSGVYGTLGTPAPGNIPGARSNASTWTDSSGNFWLFGGSGFDSTGTSGPLNDLWELNPLTRQWTWVAGSNTVNASGVYGTLGTPAAGNTPGARASASSWTDTSGNLWLFGGSGVISNATAYFNDLWKFDSSARQWTWMGGSNVPNQYGVYGTLGTPAAGNIPGSRDSVTTWTDSNGNVWLFGGHGYDGGSIGAFNTSALNDLWKFDSSTHQWTWISGSSTFVCPSCSTTFACPATGCYSQPGVYGTLGTPAVGNTPGGRFSASGWTDSNGNLWLFGGATLFGGEGLSAVFLNDLWEFNPSTSEWAWMGGSMATTINQPGVYGTQGVPATGNIPGSRDSAFTWTDQSGKFWLLGGLYESPNFTSNSTNFNDLWEFDPQTLEWTWVSGNGTLDCSGTNYGCGQPATYGTLGFPAAGNDPGGRYSVAAWHDTSDNLWLLGGLDHLTTSVNPYRLNDLWELGAVAPPSAPVFGLAAGSYTGSQTLTITDSSPGAVIYYTTDGSTPSISSNIYSSPVTLSNTTTVTAFAAVSGLMNSPLTTAKYTLRITPAITVTPSASSITTAQPLTVTVSVSGSNGAVTGSVTLSSGNYTSPAATLSSSGASINIAAGQLPAGTDTLTATYTPDTTSSPIYTTASGAASVVVTVPVPVTFTLSNSSNIAISRGAATGNTGTSTISATPSGGFTGSVNLSCAISAPANVVDVPTCGLSPVTAAITGSGAVTSILTVATTAPTSAINHPFRWMLAPASGVAFACMCFLGLPGKRARRGWFVVLLLAVVSISMSGCASGPSGSSGGSGGTTVGSYTVTVTGISGSITQSTSLSLSVTN